MLERHRRLALAESRERRDGAEEAGENDLPPRPLPFRAPDAASVATGDVLLVDEAASLPLPRLQTLLGRYRRLVLATTSEGHESAGRAFALRLPSLLDRERPGWLRLTPAAPLRWRAGDPLDTLVSETLLVRPASRRRRSRSRRHRYRRRSRARGAHRRSRRAGGRRARVCRRWRGFSPPRTTRARRSTSRTCSTRRRSRCGR